MNVLEKILEEIDKKADYYETDEQGREHVIEPFSAYWDGKEWTDINDELLEGIIAWCPLPEPYRPKVKTKE